jgi:hypothetical protein
MLMTCKQRTRLAPASGRGLVEALLVRLLRSSRAGSLRASLAFEQACESRLRRHVRAEKLVAGVLHVRVDTGVFMTELCFLRPQLLARLQEILGAGTVREIRLRAGQVQSHEQLREGRGESRGAVAGEDWLEGRGELSLAELEGIVDPELRDALLRLIRPT